MTFDTEYTEKYRIFVLPSPFSSTPGLWHHETFLNFEQVTNNVQPPCKNCLYAPLCSPLDMWKYYWKFWQILIVCKLIDKPMVLIIDGNSK